MAYQLEPVSLFPLPTPMTAEPYALVVDDERVIANTRCMILKSRGYAAVAAYSGEEALSYSMKHPPRMLISNVVMSGMTGFELAIQLKDRVPKLRNSVTFRSGRN
jgi:CheY-like chemotaxis protein